MTLRFDTPHRWFLVGVLILIGVVMTTSFVVYSLQPRLSPATTNLVFQPATLVNGNASFGVWSMSVGPLAVDGFRVRLLVNNFAGGPVALGPNGTETPIEIGPNAYKVTWIDANGDQMISVGDWFLITGDRSPLPSLSDYEFDLEWGSSWTARVYWSTY